jgi:hypothetical protein
MRHAFLKLLMARPPWLKTNGQNRGCPLPPGAPLQPLVLGELLLRRVLSCEIRETLHRVRP